MKIAVLGGTRGIGRELVRQVLQKGWYLKVLARDPSKLDVTSDSLTVLSGDALNPEAVRQLVTDQDAVCSCIGIPPTRQRVTLFSESTAHILNCIGETSAARIVVVTGVGAGDSRGHGGFFYERLLFPLLLRNTYEDKNRQEELLRNSTTNWTIVRPGSLTNGPRTGHYRVLEDLTGVTLGRISRADVADFIVKGLHERTYERAVVNLSY